MRTKLGVSGSVLKWIAVVTMAIDHAGACFLEVFALNVWGGSPFGERFTGSFQEILEIDMILRYIGRVAFPIFCFLLVEGFLHTRNVKKYAVRLGIFALISEIPFDLALHLKPFAWENQNVYFTLFLGLLTIWFMKTYGETLPVRIVGLAGGALLAELLHTDYGAFGVGLIAVLYLLRNNRLWQCVLGALCCVWEYTAPLAFVPVYLYNGERGRQPKWFFYWFYPVHLLAYYAIGMWVLPGILM